ncbi:MAG: CoA transferase [Betaproteobacteria bacterium]|nr:CoA transferase [Betaproteobacteria bacterium]
MSATNTDLPFDGVKVLDLSQGIAGPYCGMHLARNGADVIKVEPPGAGCWSRLLGKHTGDQTAHSVIVNRAKRSLAVDLKTAEGVAIVQKLAAECDVLIQNYRVGKIDKFKLDYASVQKTNPNIIYLSITGFGATGPLADQPATDSVMQAYTGMMAINRDVNGAPQRIEMLAIDFSTGLYTFQAVAAALYRKAMKGRGAHIETSLLECALALQEGAMMEHHLQGGAAEPIGMPVGMFKTKDGYMSVNARRDEHFKRLCKLLGKEAWITDPRYADSRARVLNREQLLADLRPHFEQKTSNEWVELLSGIDILKAKVNTYDDLFKDPQVQTVDAIRWVENDTLGRVPMGNLCGQQPLESGDRLAHAPHVGEHTREILGELGYGSAAIDTLNASGVIGCHQSGTAKV